jgi:hypothetical protein
MKLAQLAPQLLTRPGAMSDYEYTDSIAIADAIQILCPYCSAMKRRHLLTIWSASAWEIRGTGFHDMTLASVITGRPVDWHTQCGVFRVNEGRIGF